MQEALRFGLIGMGSGALYVVAAIGLVLVYRGSGVVNFAHGAIGMAGTYLFWELRDERELPVVVAVVAGVLFSAAIGVLTHVLVMRKLANAAMLTKVVATLGVMAILQAVAQLRYPFEFILVERFLPDGTVTVFGGGVGQDRFVILGVGILLTAILYFVYRYTSFGLATAAVAENELSASTLGLSPNIIAALNWGIGSGLAGLAGILLAPITGLNATQFTLLIIPMLATAVIGGFSSFPLALVGGLLIGTGQGLLTRYVETPGWSVALPFIVIAVVLLARGRPIAARGSASSRIASVGTGRVRPGVVLGAVGFGLFVIWMWFPIRWVDALTLHLIVAILLLSLVVVVGFAGQLSLAQFGFAGLGGLVAARLVGEQGVPLEFALLIGVAAAIPVGIIVGLAGSRTRGINLAIVTLGLAVTLESLVLTNPKMNGGISGVAVGSQTLFGWDIFSITHPERYATVCLFALVLMSLAVANLRRGRAGRRLLAVRANERAASALGIPSTLAKVYAFTFGAMIAALSGILLVFRSSTATFGQFGVLRSIHAVQEAVVGSVGWVAGPFLGAGLEPGATGTRLLDFLGEDAEEYIFLIGGVLLLLTILRAPDGLAAMNHHVLQRIGGVVRGKRPGGAASDNRELIDAHPTDERQRVVPMRLEVAGLTVRFGGVVAVNDVSLHVDPGEIVGLIGPNGAGKTTILDGLTNFVRPWSGTIRLDGNDINSLSIHRRAYAGLARSFQSLELFDDLSVRENLLAACEQRDVKAYLTDLVRPGTPKLTPVALAAVREFQLEEDLDRRPSELPYGRRRLVAIARAVSAGPSVLLLDEPAAGLDEHETAELGALIRRLAAEWGMGVLLIEHNVAMVLAVCDRICALDFGSCIGSGTPEEIRHNDAVVSAYLGGSDVRSTNDEAHAEAEQQPISRA